MRTHTNILNRALFFLATVIVAFLVMMGESQPAQIPVASTPQPASKYLEYSIVEGYFQQSDSATDDKNFDYVRSLLPSTHSTNII